MRHGAAADQDGGICEEARVVVRRGPFIPELTTAEPEARLGLPILGHSGLGGILGNVTARRPAAQP